MEKKLSTQLSKISNIPENILDNLNKLSVNTIAEIVYEASLQNDFIINLDIGIGNLLIKRNESDVNLKFIPSKQLEDDIAFIYKNNESPLKNTLKKNLKAKLVDTYKEIL